MAAQYVEVCDPNGEPLRVNLSNGALLISSIDDAFRGVFGLKYKDKSTGAKYAVQTDPINQVFLAPPGGWGNKTFELVPLPNRSASVTPDRPASPWLHVQRELPLIDSVSEFCFYLKKEVSSDKENEPKKEVKTCVTRINKRYFATFYHDLHKDFEEGNVVEIFSNDDKAFKATCKFKNTLWDFILFKSNEDVKGDGPHIFDVFYPGERIILYGRATDDGRLAPQEGIINSLEGYWDGKKHATFLMGTIKTNRGDSGGGVFNHSGLLGISVGNTPFEDFPYSQAAREAAEFNSRNYIISAKDLAAAAEQVEGTRKKEVHQPRPGPPPIVRACMGLPKKRGRPDDDTEEY
ncbi:unnamed protein product [Meloidogyne enterolobii]|uniref:Uncharacterized protein n=1 Tax=Meloidogyne enterolobii TaxID=390850 RepID=A0ACB1AJH9_MELEN